jgi:hypothetical protein
MLVAGAALAAAERRGMIGHDRWRHGPPCG